MIQLENVWKVFGCDPQRAVTALRRDPDARLPASAFTPVWFDESATQLRGRRWRAARTPEEVFLRTYRDRPDGVPDSYQALAAVEKSAGPSTQA